MQVQVGGGEQKQRENSKKPNMSFSCSRLCNIPFGKSIPVENLCNIFAERGLEMWRSLKQNSISHVHMSMPMSRCPYVHTPAHQTHTQFLLRQRLTITITAQIIYTYIYYSHRLKPKIFRLKNLQSFRV